MTIKEKELIELLAQHNAIKVESIKRYDNTKVVIGLKL
jgi:hypothetical protein